MVMTRRGALRLALFGTLAAGAARCTGTPAFARATPLGGYGLDAAALGLRPGAEEDQSALLTRLLADAARRRQPLILPSGRYRLSGVALPEGTQLLGVAGGTELVAAGPGPILAARKASRITLSGLGFDGLARRQPGRVPLLAVEDIAEARLEDLAFVNSGALGLMLLRTGGRVAGSRFGLIADTGLHALDSKGLFVENNVFEDIGSNAVQVWRSVAGDDGSVLRGNRISRIRNDGGGDGQNGNGISLFRAGGVLVEGNVFRDCALTFVRNNGGSGVQILGNNGQRCGEVALYSEFAFEGAIISNNRVEDVAQGVNITNLDHGGRLAVCSGNLIRRVRKGLAPGGKEPIGGIGIHVEAEAAVTGNVVEDVSDTGLSLGWSFAMRNLVATGNMIRNAEIGIGVSLVPKERNVVVANNVIAGARGFAVAGTEHGRVVTGDLSRGPDRRAAGVRVEGNAVG